MCINTGINTRINTNCKLQNSTNFRLQAASIHEAEQHLWSSPLGRADLFSSAILIVCNFGIFLSYLDFTSVATYHLDYYCCAKVSSMAGVEVVQTIRILGSPETWDDELPENHSEYTSFFY